MRQVWGLGVGGPGARCRAGICSGLRALALPLIALHCPCVCSSVCSPARSKFELYTMEWGLKEELRDCLVAAAPYGGPIGRAGTPGGRAGRFA